MNTNIILTTVYSVASSVYRQTNSRYVMCNAAVALQAQAVHLVAEPFSVENGLLTPSFKLKRPQAKEAFTDAIAAMYRRLDS